MENQKIKGQCEKCKKKGTMEIGFSENGMPKKYVCTACEWEREYIKQEEVVVKISREGALSISEMLRNAKNGDVIEVQSVSKRIVFIIQKDI